MWSRYASGLVCVLVAAFAAMLPARAFAELGGDLKSVQRDRARMKAAVTVRQTERYAIHEMTSGSGSPTVREFATPGGRVFAVAWQGPFHPDYKQLLGPYFDQLQRATEQAAQQRRARRAPVMIEAPGFVFQSFGHARSLAGRAYISQMLPAGVSVEEIR